MSCEQQWFFSLPCLLETFSKLLLLPWRWESRIQSPVWQLLSDTSTSGSGASGSREPAVLGRAGSQSPPGWEQPLSSKPCSCHLGQGGSMGPAPEISNLIFKVERGFFASHGWAKSWHLVLAVLALLTATPEAQRLGRCSGRTPCWCHPWRARFFQGISLENQI